MARPGVSYLDVAQAANAIQAANEYPSIERIRQKLGTGSSTTIANHLKQWKAEHMPTVVDAPKTTLPIPLLTQIQSFWDELRQSAQGEFENKETTYQNKITSLNEALASHTEALNTAKVQSEEQRHCIAELQQKLEGLKQLNAQQAEEITTLKSKVITQDNSIKSKTEIITTLQEQLKNVTSSLEHFHAAAQKQRDKDTLKHASAVNRLEQTIHELKQQKEADVEKHQQLLIKNERSDFRVEQLALETEQVKSQLVTKIEENAAYKTKLEESANFTKTLALRLEEITNSYSGLQQKHHELELQHNNLKHDNQHLKAELVTKDEKIVDLTGERDGLAQENKVLLRKVDKKVDK